MWLRKRLIKRERPSLRRSLEFTSWRPWVKLNSNLLLGRLWGHNSLEISNSWHPEMNWDSSTEMEDLIQGLSSPDCVAQRIWSVPTSPTFQSVDCGVFLVQSHCLIIAVLLLSGGEFRTRDCWLEISNAISVPCHHFMVSCVRLRVKNRNKAVNQKQSKEKEVSFFSNKN